MNHITYPSIARNPYLSNATMIWCIDCRFEEVLQQFIKNNDLTNVDLIKFPGASKTLAKPYDSAEFKLFAKSIAACSILHQQSTIILTNHASCGAYSLENQFNTDEEEKQKLISDLKIAKANLEKFLEENYKDKGIKVKTIFVNLNQTENA